MGKAFGFDAVLVELKSDESVTNILIDGLLVVFVY